MLPFHYIIFWLKEREKKEWRIVVLYCDKERKVMEARFLSFSHYTPPFLVLCAVLWCVEWREERAFPYLALFTSNTAHHRTRTSHSSLFSSRFNSRSSFVIEAKERKERWMVNLWSGFFVLFTQLHSFGWMKSNKGTTHYIPFTTKSSLCSLFNLKQRSTFPSFFV